MGSREKGQHSLDKMREGRINLIKTLAYLYDRNLEPQCIPCHKFLGVQVIPVRHKTAAIKMAESHWQEGNNCSFEEKDGFSISLF